MSRLLGGHCTPDCALQRACKPLIIHQSEYPILESHSFLERVCCSTSSGQERLRGLSVLEKGADHYLQYTDVFNKTQYAIGINTAHSHTRKWLSSLLTNPQRGPQEEPKRAPRRPQERPRALQDRLQRSSRNDFRNSGGAELTGEPPSFDRCPARWPQDRP